MSWSEVAKISSNITELEGVYIQMVLVRKYISTASSHVVGYVGKPDKNTNLKLSKVDDARVGKLAIEAAYDNGFKESLDLKEKKLMLTAE